LKASADAAVEMPVAAIRAADAMMNFFMIQSPFNVLRMQPSVLGEDACRRTALMRQLRGALSMSLGGGAGPVGSGFIFTGC
jgi:hypothetical protein